MINNELFILANVETMFADKIQGKPPLNEYILMKVKESSSYTEIASQKLSLDAI
jgi:hypothetical protein